jgi:hypothetical protein
MKNLCSTISIVVFLFICSNRIQAQTSQKQLNQVELMKQYIGSWKADLSKDTTLFFNYKSFGTGLECNYKIVIKGVETEGKQLLGYDKGIDKFLVSVITKGTDMKLYGNWFISKNKYVLVLYSDISSPEKASYRADGEFKSLDLFIETHSINGKSLKTITYKRVKE